MRIPEEVLDKIRTRLRIQDIIGASVDLTGKGERLWGCCPFHHEKTPSFAVTPSLERYYCFGCKKTGNIFNFLMETQGLSFVEAVEQLAEIAGVEIPRSDYDSSYEEQKKALFQLHDGLQKTFAALFEREHGERARAYLKMRKMPEHLITEAGIGYAPADGNWLYRYLTKKHFSPELLAECGLFSKNNPQYSLMSDRIIFPIMDQRGRCIAFGGRALRPDARAKYINSSNTRIFSKSQQLYGMHAAQKEMYKIKRAILCEGYFDVLAFQASGMREALAPLGTACTEEHLKLIQKQIEELVLCFDGDSAGQMATMRVIKMAFALDMHVRVLSLPEKKDPWDMYVEGGEAALTELVAGAEDGLAWALARIEKQCGDLHSARAKDIFVSKALAFISDIDTHIVREEALRQIALSVGSSIELIREEAEHIKQRQASRRIGIVPDEDIPEAAERRAPIQLDDTFGRMLLACTVAPSCFAIVRQSLGIDDFPRPELREIYAALELAYRANDLTLEFLLCKIENSKIHEYILGAVAKKEYDINPERFVRESVASLHLSALQQHAAMLVRDITRAEEQGLPRVRDLMDEYEYVLSEIQHIKRESEEQKRSS